MKRASNDTIITQAARDANIVQCAQRILRLGIQGLTRIMVTPFLAKAPAHCSWIQKNSTVVIFIRNDGWSLATSQEFLAEAENLWHDNWCGIIYKTNKHTYITSYQEWIKEGRPFGLSSYERAILTKEEKQERYNLKRQKADWRTS